MAAENLQLKQRLQSSEAENARLHQEAAEQAAVVQPLQEENTRLHEENQPLREENERLRQFEEAVCKERYGPSWSGKATDIDIIDNLARLSPHAAYNTTQM